MARTLPYVDGMVVNYLRNNVDQITGEPQFGTFYPDTDLASFPFVYCTVVSSNANANFPRLAGRFVLDIQVWDRVSKRQCDDIAEDIRNLLIALWEQQIVLPEGHVVYYTEEAGPAQIQPDEKFTSWRNQALYALTVRPNS